MPDSEMNTRWPDTFEAQVLNGVVDQAIFERFSETHGYDAATPIGWLQGRLALLLNRVRRGEPVKLYTPDGAEEVQTESEYRAWAARHFPGAKVSND